MYKYKELNRSLIIVLLVTFLFLPFSKPKKANAIAGIDDAIIVYLGLSFLAVAGYTIITSDDDMIQDIGRTVGGMLDSFYDYTIGEDSIICTVTDNIADKLTQSYIGENFGVPKSISKISKLPYGARLVDSNNYGDIVTSQETLFKLDLYLDNVYQKTLTDNNYTPIGKTMKFYTSEPNSAGVYRVFLTDGDWWILSNETIWKYGANNKLNYYTIELSAIDRSGNPITSIDLTNKITVPYDGTQVTISDTPVAVAPGTTITIPKDKVISGSIPNTITNEKDLGIEVSKPGTGEGVITGWKWLDNILNFILNAIKAIPSAIGALFVPAEFIPLDLSPLYVSFKDKFPFCLPWDLYNFISSFKSSYVAPHWEYTMSGFEGPFKAMNGFSFEVDLQEWGWVGAISRFISLAIWCVFLVFLFKRINP